MADPIKLRSEDVAHIRDWIQKQPHLPSGIPGKHQHISTLFLVVYYSIRVGRPESNARFCRGVAMTTLFIIPLKVNWFY